MDRATFTFVIDGMVVSVPATRDAAEVAAETVRQWKDAKKTRAKLRREAKKKQLELFPGYRGSK